MEGILYVYFFIYLDLINVQRMVGFLLGENVCFCEIYSLFGRCVDNSVWDCLIVQGCREDFLRKLQLIFKLEVRRVVLGENQS